MKRFEYQVVPAPKKGEKTKGAKTPAERFALALTQLMNKLGAEGWDYIRADTLPCEERVGLTGSKAVFQNMLVFRREIVIASLDLPLPTPPLRKEPRLSPIPVELFSDPEPCEVEPLEEPLEDLPKLDPEVRQNAG